MSTGKFFKLQAYPYSPSVCIEPTRVSKSKQCLPCRPALMGGRPYGGGTVCLLRAVLGRPYGVGDRTSSEDSTRAPLWCRGPYVF